MIDRYDEIQSGWKVVASDGHEIGTVVGTGEDGIRVKKTGLLGGEVTVPANVVEEVETGRVELAVTKGELDKAH